MHWLARVAAATIVRRLVGLALLAVLAWLGMGQAHAQAFPGEWESGNTRYTANQGAAVSQCSAKASSMPGTTYNHSCARVTINTTTAAHPTAGGVLVDGYYRCGNYSKTSGSYMGECSGVSRYYWAAGVDCPVGEVWDATTKTCAAEAADEEECLARPEVVGQWATDGDPATQDLVCHEGCTYGAYQDPVEGTYYSTFNDASSGWFGACVVGTDPDPQPWVDTDGDGVEDPADDFPTDPTESTDTDGDGVGDNKDSAPGDPDNGSDDGTGNESDNVSSGGGSCAEPPVSSGDGILTQIAYQTWATRCAVEGNGNGDGDPASNAGVEARLDGILDWLTDEPVLDAGPALPEESIDGSMSDWEQGYIADNDTCPAPHVLALEFMGEVAPMEFSLQPICDFVTYIRTLVIALGLLSAGYIVAGLRSA